jgi:hypothetical protein
MTPTWRHFTSTGWWEIYHWTAHVLAIVSPHAATDNKFVRLKQNWRLTCSVWCEHMYKLARDLQRKPNNYCEQDKAWRDVWDGFIAVDTARGLWAEFTTNVEHALGALRTTNWNWNSTECLLRKLSWYPRIEMHLHCNRKLIDWCI